MHYASGSTPQDRGNKQPDDRTRYTCKEMYGAINYPQQIRCPKQCCPYRIECEEDKHGVVPTAWPVIALVSITDEEGSEPQLCHGANGNEGEKERMIMGLDVWHFVKKQGPRKVRGRTEMTREEGN